MKGFIVFGGGTYENKENDHERGGVDLNTSIGADLVRISLAVLSVLKLVLSGFGINLEQEVINDIVNILAGIVAIYGFVKHNFIGKKGKKQKANLKENGLL
jgi:uncharacterized membrane protein